MTEKFMAINISNYRKTSRCQATPVGKKESGIGKKLFNYDKETFHEPFLSLELKLSFFTMLKS